MRISLRRLGLWSRVFQLPPHNRAHTKSALPRPRFPIVGNTVGPYEEVVLDR